MSEQGSRAAAIQEVLGLSKQDALKVLIFIAGLQAGERSQSTDEADRQRSTAVEAKGSASLDG